MRPVVTGDRRCATLGVLASVGANWLQTVNVLEARLLTFDGPRH